MKKDVCLGLGAGLAVGALVWLCAACADPLGTGFTVLVFSAASAGIILAFREKT